MNSEIPSIFMLYLFFGELPDCQDVLANQWVQQRGHLEVGCLPNHCGSWSRLWRQQPGQRRRVSVPIATADHRLGKREHLYREQRETMRNSAPG